MPDVAVTYIGHLEHASVADVGNDFYLDLVERDQTVDVPAAVAGHPPTPAQGDPADPDYVPEDPGVGLLAQTANWVPAAAGDSYDGSVDTVLAKVGSDPVKAQAAIAWERAHKNRKTLIADLEAIATADGGQA